MKQMKHWQDPVNALLGAWLILSPWAIGFADQQVAMANFVAVGALLVAAALGAIFVPQAWEEWVEVALGVWLVASPWVLGFADTALAMQNAVLAGLMVTILALWVLATDKEFGGLWSDLTDSTRLP
jgi:hypothetical protein